MKKITSYAKQQENMTYSQEKNQAMKICPAMTTMMELATPLKQLS